MSKFKIGDRVRRTHSSYMNMGKGDIDIITSLSVSGDLRFKGVLTGGHSSCNFELAEVKPKGKLPKYLDLKEGDTIECVEPFVKQFGGAEFTKGRHYTVRGLSIKTD